MKRVNLFLGHYGTGKTNIALNFALMAKNNLTASYKKVTVYDLDIVNPYFRTLDGKETLNNNGIELVASEFANTNVDVPAMNPETYRMIVEKNEVAVVDIGGDDRGAYALGRFRDEIKKENNYEMFLIINKYRFETRNVEDTLEIKREIEEVAGIKFTAIINNSNLGIETTKEIIENAYDYAKGVEEATGLKVQYTSIRKDLISSISKDKILGEVLPIELIKYGKWL